MRLFAKIKAAIIFSYCLSLVHTMNAQESSKLTREKNLVHDIDGIIQSQVNNNEIPGAVILIKEGNHIILKKAYGYAKKFDQYGKNLIDPEPFTTAYLFDLASLTKVVGTTTAIMYLADQHIILVDDPVSKYIDAFNTVEKKAITIKHLLTHTSGLPEWYPMYYKSNKKEDTYALIASLPLSYPIGVERKYSDLGFTILGQLIEVVSGKPLEQFIQEKIHGPLKMMHTMYNPLKNGNTLKIAPTSFGNPYEKRMVYEPALGFSKKEINPTSWNAWRNYSLIGEVNDGNAWYANGGISGAAGLFSTLDDLQLLVDFLMQKNINKRNPIISQKTIQEFLTKDEFNNGLGWMMDTTISLLKNAPAGSYGHTGFTGTSIAIIPQYKISVVLLINRQQKGLLSNGTYYNVSPLRAKVMQAILEYAQ